ncbi:hypothetical protein H1P_650024 [Hyella patelloides LEGE 07179]|uniref:Uncharacterized protein n=1 Tax=Hyella patelloides LEGE 07179 TaxID=945734 RepID=A0A563W2E8_9CYAN|nr:hypothetical protein H1P_650024 [Hyella patelloides LEGE 07179]
MYWSKITDRLNALVYKSCIYLLTNNEENLKKKTGWGSRKPIGNHICNSIQTVLRY